MTHELNRNDEAEGGPANDDRLPEATSLPVFSDVADSDLPELQEDLED